MRTQAAEVRSVATEAWRRWSIMHGMNDDPITRRFRGSVRLVTWHLWRVAETTDIDACFEAAKGRGMIDDKAERFIRSCMDEEARLEAGGAPSPIVGMDAVKELQTCAIRLNTADSA